MLYVNHIPIKKKESVMRKSSRWRTIVAGKSENGEWSGPKRQSWLTISNAAEMWSNIETEELSIDWQYVRAVSLESLGRHPIRVCWSENRKWDCEDRKKSFLSWLLSKDTKKIWWEENRMWGREKKCVQLLNVFKLF